MRIFRRLRDKKAQNKKAEQEQRQVKSPTQPAAVSAPTTSIDSGPKSGSMGNYLKSGISSGNAQGPKKGSTNGKTNMKPKKHEHAEQTDGRAPQPDSSSGIGFDELYRLKNVLGQGAFSTVREAKHKNHPSQTFAVKCVDRAKLSKEDEEALVDEVAILREFNHEAIICLYDFFKERKMYYLILEQMSGGELFDRIVAKAYYNEKEARDVCKTVLEAVGYCHSNNVAHRDLKPENLLLVSQTDDMKVKIADFGFAKRVKVPNSLTTQCGTPGYVAPEILEGRKYDTKADMWSVGVILYILLGGYPPFVQTNQRLLFRKIKKGQYEFHAEYWGSVSEDAKGLISSLLNIDPEARLSADEALKNQWILSDAGALESKDLGTNLAEFKKFNAKRKFKAAVKSVMAIQKLSSLGLNFKQDLDDISDDE